MSRAPDLRGQQRAFLLALLDAAPEGGWPPLWQAAAYPRDSVERYVRSMSHSPVHLFVRTGLTLHGAFQQVAVHLRWHIKNAVDLSEPRDALVERLVTTSTGLAYTAAASFGVDEIVRLRMAAEARGDFLVAGMYANAVATVHFRGGQRLDQSDIEYVSALKLLAQVNDASKGAGILEMERSICELTLNQSIAQEGIFSDPMLMDFIRKRQVENSERRRLMFGHASKAGRTLNADGCG
jgi:hypothetical protein